MRTIPVIAACMFLLAACGGSGSGMQMSDSDDGGTQATPPPTRQLSVGPALKIGENPAYSASAADTRLARLASSSNRFRAYTVTIDRDWSFSEGHPDAVAKLIDNALSILSVRSDGNYGMHVTYSDGSENRFELHLPATSLQENGSLFVKRQQSDEFGYGIWAQSSTPFAAQNYGGHDGYVSFLGGFGPSGQLMFSAYGVETPAAGLPSGTATYSGVGYAYMFDNSVGNVSSARGRTAISFTSNLEVDFADNSLTGRLDATRIRLPGTANFISYSGTGFDVTNGAIVDGQLTASLTGTDSDSNRPAADSLRGYSGNAVGAFYGPAADEAAAVFSASRDSRVMMGFVYGAK